MKSYSKYTCFPAIFPVTPAKSPYTCKYKVKAVRNRNQV